MSRESSERTYSAFISYRHAPVDTAVAKEVQFRLEHYHLPKDVKEQTGITTLAPIFRDEDELAITPELTKSIAVALKNSAALIVICSPRTSESTWVQKEINEFLSMHDRSRVFVVMAEGTADEVTPEVLLHRVNEDGEVVACDPLAANFRQDCKGQYRANEVTRLAAGLLGMSYDSLAQRALRERTRRRRIIAAVVFGLLLAFTLYTINMNLRIFRNYQEALRRRSEFLAGQASEMVDEGNTVAAMELALAALPADGSWDELFRPVVPEAVLALQRATNAGTLVAEDMTSFGTSEVYATGAEIAHLNISPEERYVAAADDTGVVTFWEVGKNAPIFSGRSALGRYNNLSHCFAMDAGKLLLAYNDGVVCRGTNGEVLWDYALVQDEDHA
ncbi:MAG: toll/interleukin-1 receptor domain-containing protein, partial [Coriobacteriales bacterium]|nr:toll/interleukin-1 receptor domain-containing protein [Coriobacteriales bacterium]